MKHSLEFGFSIEDKITINFTIFDIALLGLFAILISLFLFKRRKNLKKEGLLLLYRTRWGMKLIDKVGDRHKKLLGILSYVAITWGFFLMAGMIYLFGKMVWIYVFQPQIVQLIKVPPILPLFPYIPQIFKLDFLPPFYFTYWIVIIAIVAISHEFAHGIFMRKHGIKIKSTGFGFFPFFLPVFLAAFVEQDEESMKKSRIRHQLAVLSAGTFANTLMALLSFIILLIFFSLAYAPAGVSFDSYSYSAVTLSSIAMINGVQIQNITYEKLLSNINEEGITNILAEGESYVLTKDFLEKQKGVDGYVLLYNDAPAINVGLENTITHINGEKITSIEALAGELNQYSPRESITLTVIGEDGKPYNMDITLAEHPDDENLPYLGIGFTERKNSGVLASITGLFSSFRDPNVYYKEKFSFAGFIYDLLWWLIIINFSVALVNMLPVGIFDGGKFFYLGILALTKKEEIAKKAFALVTYVFLALLAVIMIFWAINLFR
jgi:membrane-associated protease RseP (regulator of RpoE activity)